MGIVERLRNLAKLIDFKIGSNLANEAADLIERLKGYAVHDEECDISQPFKGVEFPPCTCGLSALIKEANDD